MTPTPRFDPSALPPRDDTGWLAHPDLPSYDDEEPIAPKLLALQLDVAIVELPAELEEQYSEQPTPGCAWWTPEAPAGGDWRLAIVAEGEEGPWAAFVRPKADAHPRVLSSCPPIVYWVVTDRPSDAPNEAIARCFHNEVPTQTVLRGASVADVVAQLPPGLLHIPRHRDDDPVIVGMWL